jgi:hypothetical protein
MHGEMPAYRYALEPGGPKRLVIKMPSLRGRALIELDGQPLATIASKLMEGTRLRLPDGRELRAAYRPRYGYAEWEVSLDGVPLPGTGDDPETASKTAAGIFAFVATASGVIGLLSLVYPESVALERLGGPWTLPSALFMALAAWRTYRGSFWACALGGGLFLADTFATPLAAGSEVNGASPGLMVRLIFLVAIVRGAHALWKQRPRTAG